MRRTVRQSAALTGTCPLDVLNPALRHYIPSLMGTKVFCSAASTWRAM